MRLTKMGHACVRLEKDGGVLVLDPGTLTEYDAVDGAQAVLITHEHFDHLDIERMRSAVTNNPQLEIWTNASVAEQLGRLDGHVHTVGHGDGFSVAGFEVGVYGERHAVIHPDFPVIANVGFLVDGEVFHPGDAFTVPDVAVGSLLVPTHAPWLKIAEVIDYLREIRPSRAYSIHDGLLNEHGLGLVDSTLSNRGEELNADCRRLAPARPSPSARDRHALRGAAA